MRRDWQNRKLRNGVYQGQQECLLLSPAECPVSIEECAALCTDQELSSVAAFCWESALLHPYRKVL